MLGAVGLPLEIIVTTFEDKLVPQSFLQTAEYVPALETVNVLPVVPVFQVITPKQFEAVNVAVSVPQILVLSATIIGDVGVPPFAIFTIFELPLTPQAFTQVAV